MTIIATFKVPISFALDHSQLKEARQALNTFHLGDKDCNYLEPESMEYKPKYPELETTEYKQAMQLVTCSNIAHIFVSLDHQGNLEII
jgi:hypothetical protein